MKYGAKETIEKFIERGYDPDASLLSVLRCKTEDAVDNRQRSYNNPDLVIEVINLLLLRGADINAKDSNGNSVFFVAVKHSKPLDVIKFLLAKGADFDLCESSWHYSLVQMLERWPLTMAVVVLQELAIYHQIDTTSIIDLFQFLQLSKGE